MRTAQPSRPTHPRDSEPNPTSLDTSRIQLSHPISADLFDSVAERAARVIAANGQKQQNKSTQLRKFYDELVMWHDKVFIPSKGTGSREERLTEYLPFIRMMNAKVSYAQAREHVDASFTQLFRHLIQQIQTPDSLKYAKLFMEAFMGFYKAQEK